MSAESDNIMLRYLRAIDTKVDGLATDVAEVKQRLTALEIQVSNLSATESSHYAHRLCENALGR
jgi:hypothetical protein